MLAGLNKSQRFAELALGLFTSGPPLADCLAPSTREKRSMPRKLLRQLVVRSARKSCWSALHQGAP